MREHNLLWRHFTEYTDLSQPPQLWPITSIPGFDLLFVPCNVKGAPIDWRIDWNLFPHIYWEQALCITG